MTMKRFLAIHTFHSDETKAAMAAMTSDDPTTQKEWAASWKFEKCQCVATWIGNDDFFFCHWLAETDEDIHNALKENGLDELVFTACYEANIHIDRACLTDDRAFPMRQTEQALLFTAGSLGYLFWQHRHWASRLKYEACSGMAGRKNQLSLSQNIPSLRSRG